MNIISILAKAVTGPADTTSHSAPLSPETSEAVYKASAGRGAPVQVAIDSMSHPTLKDDRQPKLAAPRKVSFEEQCRFVAADLPKPSKSEMQALKSLQERCDRTWDDICKTFNRDAAQRDFAGFDREQWNKIYESGNDLSDCTVVTREDFFHDYEDKQQAAKRLHEKLRESGRDLCKPIITQFADAAKAVLHRLETAERSEAGALGFEFVPSPRVQVLRQLLVRLNNFQKSPHAGTPRQLLSWLEI